MYWLRKLAHWVDTDYMPTTRTRLAGPMSQRIRTARTGAGITQQQLAGLTGLALKTINNYENPLYLGKRKRVYVAAIATACGRELKEIWGAADQQPSLRSGWLSATADRSTDGGVLVGIL